MKTYALTPSCRLVLEQADLTKADVDAIVNAANERMLGGGGVDGAIHRAAGAQLLEACYAVSEVRPGVRCPTGEARITPGFKLKARHIIHTVGPIYRDANHSAPLLAAAYRSCLRLANQQGLQSLAFPAISCGVFGYPLDEAAELALLTCRDGCGRLTEVRFCLFGEPAWHEWHAAAERLFHGPVDDEGSTIPG